MPFLPRREIPSVRFLVSPKGLQNDIKFHGSTFDPANETALDTRDGDERQEFPGPGEERKPFAWSTLVQGNKGIAFFRVRRISGRTAIPGELLSALR